MPVTEVITEMRECAPPRADTAAAVGAVIGGLADALRHGGLAADADGASPRLRPLALRTSLVAVGGHLLSAAWSVQREHNALRTLDDVSTDIRSSASTDMISSELATMLALVADDLGESVIELSRLGRPGDLRPHTPSGQVTRFSAPLVHAAASVANFVAMSDETGWTR